MGESEAASSQLHSVASDPQPVVSSIKEGGSAVLVPDCSHMTCIQCGVKGRVYGYCCYKCGRINDMKKSHELYEAQQQERERLGMSHDEYYRFRYGYPPE